MRVILDGNLKKVLVKVYDAISVRGGEVSVSGPEYKQTEIDALISKGLLYKIDASTLESWAYIVRPTYEGEQACMDEKKSLWYKVNELIKRGEEVGINEIYAPQKATRNTIGGPMYDKWMGEINIFNERHLKEHPLFNSIHSTYFHRQSKTSYDDMMGHLRALESDEEFFGAIEGKREDVAVDNTTIAQMLIRDIDRCKLFLKNPKDESIGKEVYDEITGRYDSVIPNFGNGLYQYYAEQHFYDPDISGDSLIFNLKKLLNKMETYLALKYPQEVIEEKRPSADYPTVNRSANGNVSNKVFIVHGHDNEAKQEMARTLEKAGFEAVILHEQPDGGCTIIEKIEKYSDVSFAVVLYTECDKGRAKEEAVDSEKYRARQNVVFEHGYLIGKLGRSHVCAFVKGKVETPGDISGVVYVPMDSNGAWKMQLGNNMKDVGIDVDLNKLCR